MTMQKYHDMKANAATPEDIYLTAREDHFDKITSIKLIRQLFNLSLEEAKAVTHNAYAQEQGISREEYNQKWADAIKKALIKLEDED